MLKENIHLDGLVLHSPEPKLELSHFFYQLLLGTPFTLEQHGSSPLHYSCQLGDKVLELYPSSVAMPSSCALIFSAPDVGAVVKRMKGHNLKPKAEHNDGKAVTFEDPEGRNVRLRASEKTDAEVRLHEIILHTKSLSEASLFYQQLLGVPFGKNSYGAGQIQFYAATKDNLVLKLWPDTVYVAPSPSLLLSCSDLDQVRSQISGYDGWKKLSDTEARLIGPDKRKIFLSQK